MLPNEAYVLAKTFLNALMERRDQRLQEDDRDIYDVDIEEAIAVMVKFIQYYEDERGTDQTEGHPTARPTSPSSSNLLQ